MSSSVPCRILLVDDEPIILQILTAVLEDGPWEILTCSKGQQALELLEEGNVGVLVSDKNLPDINGLELLRFAKQADPSTEVLIITGYASLETALAALELGAFDYILKPLNNVFEVRHKVEKAVERRALSLQNSQLIEELSSQNRQLQQALLESSKLSKKLLQSEKLAGLGTLAAGMAHEISSPLFGVLGLAEAMREESSLESCHALASEIIDYANSMREIVVDLTRYARPADSLPNSEIPIRQIVADAIRLVGHTIPVDHIEFKNQAHSTATLQASANEMQQILVNLIKNAAEACSQESGVVGISTRETEGLLELQVWDNGSGIPEEDLPRIFDPFYTTKVQGKGTGLGLNVVYRIATRYRGIMDVENRDSGGALFTLSLPLQA